RTPASYYHPGSPIGQVLSAMPSSVTARAAIIGLGTGSIACYSEPGERWTFYEIDPAVERIARDPRLFTYLRACPGEFDVVIGDARLRLSRAADRRYGLIMADAFSSDAVPVHLITREALALYRSKLREHGLRDVEAVRDVDAAGDADHEDLIVVDHPSAETRRHLHRSAVGVARSCRWSPTLSRRA
nr:fused MFS/spermidine synthase [Solirubrobacterales bacterium]